jgi:hypothetical protein
MPIPASEPSPKMSTEMTSEASQTTTPEFRQWFANSRVRNERDQPLIVYHGTNTHIDKFKPSRIQREGTELNGFYFSPDYNVANYFAGSQGKPKQIVGAYLSLQNPFIAKDSSQAMKSLGLTDQAQLTRAITQRGYDGAWFKEAFTYKDKTAEEIIVFDHKQIAIRWDEMTFAIDGRPLVFFIK